MRRILSCAAFLIACLSSAIAGEAEDLAWASKRGGDLFDYDRAAWVASDALMAELKDMPRGKPGGWVVTAAADNTLEVSFVADDGGRYYRFYVATVRDHRVIKTAFTKGADEALTADQLAMIAARNAAVMAVAPVCVDSPYNTVVLPSSTIRGANDVYLLTPQLDAAIYPVGGHTRVTVGDDGGIIAKHAFLNTCLTFGGEKDIPADVTDRVAVVSHVNDPLPTEIHVFVSIWMQGPMVVVIPETEKAWMVAGTEITPFDIGK